MSEHQPTAESPGTQEVWLGHKKLQFPSPELGQLEDHTGLLGAGDWPGLRAQLEEKGYLRLRGLLDRGQVMAARKGALTIQLINQTISLVVLQHVADSGPEKLEDPLESGVLDSRCSVQGTVGGGASLAFRCGRGCVPFMEGRNGVTHR